MKQQVYDYVIIGSGFGGSVSAMRLTEKGYSVLVLEKGWMSKAQLDDLLSPEKMANPLMREPVE